MAKVCGQARADISRIWPAEVEGRFDFDYYLSIGAASRCATGVACMMRGCLNTSGENETGRMRCFLSARARGRTEGWIVRCSL